MTSSELLAEIVRTWAMSHNERRDSYLKIGGLLAEFVSIRMKEGDGLNEKDRLAKRCSRMQAVEDACAALDLGNHVINVMIGAHYANLLLSDGKSLANLSWSSLRALTTLVERNKGKIQRSRNQRSKGKFLTLSETDIWQVNKATTLELAKGLFARAISEDWSCVKVRNECHWLLGRKIRRPQPKSEGPSAAPMSLKKIAQTSNPKDLADMILELINLSTNKEEVLDLVEQGLGLVTK